MRVGLGPLADAQGGLLEEADLKKNDPKNYAAILQTTAEIKSLTNLLHRFSRRLAEPQQWCPKCLNNVFDMAV